MQLYLDWKRVYISNPLVVTTRQREKEIKNFYRNGLFHGKEARLW